MNKDGLKPCPFCGREIDDYDVWWGVEKGITHLVVRCECGVRVEVVSCGVEVFSHFGSKFVGDTALDIWNKRTVGGEDDETDRR